MTGKDEYILEVVRNLLRTHIDKQARVRRDGGVGIVYYLKLGSKFKRKFVTIHKARKMFYELYPDRRR